MRKTFFSLCMAAVASMSVFSLAACGGSDDPDNPDVPGQEKATSVTISPVVYVSASVIKYFDVSVTDASGKTVQLTTDNTTEPSTLVSNLFLANANTLKATVATNPGDKLLAYTIPCLLYTSDAADE